MPNRKKLVGIMDSGVSGAKLADRLNAMKTKSNSVLKKLLGDDLQILKIPGKQWLDTIQPHTITYQLDASEWNEHSGGTLKVIATADNWSSNEVTTTIGVFKGRSDSAEKFRASLQRTGMI